MRIAPTVIAALFASLSVVAAQDCDPCPQAVGSEAESTCFANCDQTFAEIAPAQYCKDDCVDFLRKQGCHIPAKRQEPTLEDFCKTFDLNSETDECRELNALTTRDSDVYGSQEHHLYERDLQSCLSGCEVFNRMSNLCRPTGAALALVAT